MDILSTGQVASLLGVPEPRINDLIRRNKIEHVPPIVAGRRLWEARHVDELASVLGLSEDELDVRLGRASKP